MTASSRTPIIAGNWKMNYGPHEATTFAEDIVPQIDRLLQGNTSVLCVLCPPSISLAAVRQVLDDNPSSPVRLGAQNMYFEEKGAFTGEISPAMLCELCEFVILGHSERRTIFGESDELVNKKVLAALNEGLRPIVCVGEHEDQYNDGQTEQVIRFQIQQSLANLPANHLKEIVIAYEPIWAIGTGKSATAEGAEQVIALIRQLFSDTYGSEVASTLPILYGGSVTSTNIGELMAQPDIDGALVGGASLKPDFIEIVRKTIESIQHN